ncbi:MAG: autotransporter-associated beta strand repeat-containing protein [Capsulimonadales bacterium]|nr:autotransporter-associated beta strand repeat-containing protein [Capsulimonadales bacterium]
MSSNRRTPSGHPWRRAARLGVAAAMAALMVRPAHAQTYTWTGGGSDLFWFTALNWDLGAPVAGADIRFTNALSANTTLNSGSGFSISSLLFGPSALATTINATTGSFLSLGSGGITHQGTATHTLAVPIALTADQTWSVASGGNLAFVGNGSDSNGGISGAFNLTKTGDGTLTLNLSAGTNTFGNLTIAGGSVVLGTRTNAHIADTARVDLTNAGTSFTINGDETIGSLAGVAGSTVNLNSFRRLTVGGDNTSSTFAGTLAGTGVLIKTGTGTLTLSGINTVDGLQIENGTVQLTAGNTIDPTTLLVMNGGVLNLAADQTIGTLTGTGGTLNNNGFTLTIGGTASLNPFAGNITGSGNLVKSGSGTLILTGTNTMTGTVSVVSGGLTIGDGGTSGAIFTNLINISAGATLTFNRSDDLVSPGLSTGTGTTVKDGGGTVALTGNSPFSGTTVINAGTLALGNGGTTGSINSGVVTVNSGGNFAFNRSDALNFGGNIGGAGTVTKNGAGTTTLSGTSTFTGGLTINAGGIQLGGNGANLADTVPVILNAGTFTLGSADETIGSLAGAAGTNVNVGFRNLITGGNNGNTTYAGVVSGSGGLVKEGTGTFTLTGTNTFTGALTVNAGTLQLGDSGTNIANTASVVVNGGTFALGAAGETIGSLAGTGGTVNTNGQTISLNNSTSTTYAGSIVGGGGIAKGGTGILTLTGANTFTGTVVVTNGGISVGNGGASGSLVGNVNLLGTVTSLTFDRSDDSTYAGTVSGNGSITKNGAGTLFLTGNNTNNGSLTVNAGSISVGNGGTTGSLANSPVTLAAGTNLTFDRSDTSTFIGSVTGTGTVTKNGAGTLNFSGTNTFTGGLTINAGNFQLGNSGVNLADSLAVTLNGGSFTLGIVGETIGSLAGTGGTVNTTGNILTVGGNDASTTFAGAIAGIGGIVKNGVGTLTLTGTSTYSGPTTVNAGTLNVTGAAASTDVTVNSGATLAATSAARNLDDITLNSGATLDPGNANTPTAIGKLRASSVTWNAGGVWKFLLGTSSAASDQVILSGALIKGSGADPFLFDFAGTSVADLNTAISSAPSGKYRYTLATFGSNSGFAASDFEYANLSQGYGGTFSLDGNNLYFDAAITPEPGTVGFVLLTGVPIAVAVRRRRRIAR